MHIVSLLIVMAPLGWDCLLGVTCVCKTGLTAGPTQQFALSEKL